MSVFHQLRRREERQRPRRAGLEPRGHGGQQDPADRPVGAGGPPPRDLPRPPPRRTIGRASSCQLFDLRIVGIDYGRHAPLRTLSGKPEPPARRGHLSFFDPRRPVALAIARSLCSRAKLLSSKSTVVTRVTICDAKRPLEFLLPEQSRFRWRPSERTSADERNIFFSGPPFLSREVPPGARRFSRPSDWCPRVSRPGRRPFQLAYMYGTSGPASGGTAVNLVGNQFESGRDGHDRRRQRQRVGDELHADRSDDAGAQRRRALRRRRHEPGRSAGGPDEGLVRGLPGRAAGEPVSTRRSRRSSATASRRAAAAATTAPPPPVTRGQMAVFLLRAEHGSAYVPPPATGTIFGDVAVNTSLRRLDRAALRRRDHGRLPRRKPAALLPDARR